MSEGRVIEQGTHEDLMARDGHYASMVRLQQMHPSSSNITSAGDSNSDEEIMEAEETHVYGQNSLEEDLDEKDVRDPDHIQNRASTGSAEVSGLERDIKSLGFGKTLAFILKNNSREYPMLILGLCCSIIAGLAISARSVVFAKKLESLSLPPSERHRFREEINLYSGLFLLLAGVLFFSWLVAGIAFARCTTKLAQRLRDRSFRSIISQDVAFFDKKEYSTGALLSILTSSVEEPSGLGGPVMGASLAFTSIVLGGVILSLAIAWKLALVCTVTLPLVVGCGWLRLQVLAVFDTKTRQNGRDAASYASELVKSVETVASLGLEEFVLDRYDEFLVQQSVQSLRPILSASSLYAASQSVVYLVCAPGFWYGGTLIANGEYSLFQFYICFSALVTGSQTAGTIFTFAPEASKAMHSSWEVKAILERESRISENDNGGDPDSDPKDTILEHGSIKFKNVSFRYPSRPERLALDNFSLKIEPGQSVALVGSSGSGKSTVFALIDRFYDPDRGLVLASGRDISKLQLGRYRQIISLVSQDAVLYSGSIRENIALGVADRDVSSYGQHVDRPIFTTLSPRFKMTSPLLSVQVEAC
ncbi:ABC transporter type 1, transmembrane domain-containing protein [Xylaria flabelliformis]|nr:ABC transporter type 1, transmembrane domain-containing protein [Xylaria flabelliformis]